MLTKEQITEDLEETQKRIDFLSLKCTDATDCGHCKSGELQELSEKMSVIVVWFMKNGYVE